MPTKHHDLKIRPKDYRDIESNGKRFEVRFNDRNFEVGDILNLCEWAGGGENILEEKLFAKSDISWTIQTIARKVMSSYKLRLY